MTTHTIDKYGPHIWTILHRDDDLPAVIREDGTREWYRDGLRHRENGPARVSREAQHWYQHGKLHRLDGPAIIKDTEEQWFLHEHRHRLDGPAIVVKHDCADPHGYFFIHGIEQFFIKTPEGLLIRKIIDLSDYPSLEKIREQLYSIDDQDLTLFRLRYNVMEVS